MISAKIIQDSITHFGKRITTFELEYPRFIHSEFMTHRQFSRNAASSRAIPIEKMNERVRENPAMPIHWGKNQSGMQAKQELEPREAGYALRAWKEAARAAADIAQELSELGVHKQIANRITEPFQTMKTVCTTTEFANWFWLRYHEDAQPEIFELAKLMLYCMDTNEPMQLKPGEWHVPYVNRAVDNWGHISYLNSDGTALTLEEAKIISASCCAQVSYRKSDDSLEKAKMVYDRLVNSEPVHASPVEHQATPMPFQRCFFNTDPRVWDAGITHINQDSYFGSGNFYGWIQHRQLIKNHVR